MFKYALSQLFCHLAPSWADAIPMFAPLKPEVSFKAGLIPFCHSAKNYLISEA
jgi:hypothetical protein